MSDKIDPENPIDADTVVVEERPLTKAEEKAADAARIAAIKEAAKKCKRPLPDGMVEYFTLRPFSVEAAIVGFQVFEAVGFLQIGERQFGNEPKEA